MGVTTLTAVCCHTIATESPTDRVLTRECSFQVLGNIGSVLLAGYPVGVSFLLRGRCLSIGEFASLIGTTTRQDGGLAIGDAIPYIPKVGMRLTVIGGLTHSTARWVGLFRHDQGFCIRTQLLPCPSSLS